MRRLSGCLVRPLARAPTFAQTGVDPNYAPARWHRSCAGDGNGWFGPGSPSRTCIVAVTATFVTADKPAYAPHRPRAESSVEHVSKGQHLSSCQRHELLGTISELDRKRP
jgi:hypothetical protein